MHFGMGLYITSSIIKQHNGQLILKILIKQRMYKSLLKFYIENNK